MNTIRIAFRNLNRQKKRTFLLGGALAFGILVITFLHAFTAGFELNIRDNFSYLISGQIYMKGYEKSPRGSTIERIRDDAPLMAALDSSPVRIAGTTKRSIGVANLIFENETVFQSVNGVDFGNEQELSRRLVIKKGSIADALRLENGIIVNELVEQQLLVDVGDTVLAEIETVNGQKNVGEFVIAAITADSGILEGSSSYAHRRYINELLDIDEEEYTSLGIFLAKPVRIQAQAAQLYAHLDSGLDLFPRVTATFNQQDLRKTIASQTWEKTRYVFSTLDDNLIILSGIIAGINTFGIVVLAIMLLIIGVGILNTYRMVIYERIREIGTMRALGMQQGGVRSIFLFEALFLAGFGLAIGLLLATVVMLVVSAIDFGTGTQLSIFMRNGHVSFVVSPWNIVAYVIVVGGITLIAGNVPASKASRLKPATALHKTY